MRTNKPRLTDLPSYDPGRLLDALIEKFSLKNDAALSRKLEVKPPLICKIRRRRTPVTDAMLIRMHEVSDLSIRELRVLMRKPDSIPNDRPTRVSEKCDV